MKWHEIVFKFNILYNYNVFLNAGKKSPHSTNLREIHNEKSAEVENELKINGRGLVTLGLITRYICRR